eukprot:TRINITY_DN13317_c0_g1_i1.p1 TRINITY_DN13317_c0_g1~~TRINITY_DN13317_c0_g1_i1.p1  ORF type:complete len:325 (-),score=35.27 TRINITY_DN13317_c0_g1_i1:294-1211(-)
MCIRDMRDNSRVKVVGLKIRFGPKHVMEDTRPQFHTLVVSRSEVRMWRVDVGPFRRAVLPLNNSLLFKGTLSNVTIANSNLRGLFAANRLEKVIKFSSSDVKIVNTTFKRCSGMITALESELLIRDSVFTTEGSRGLLSLSDTNTEMINVIFNKSALAYREFPLTESTVCRTRLKGSKQTTRVRYSVGATWKEVRNGSVYKVTITRFNRKGKSQDICERLINETSLEDYLSNVYRSYSNGGYIYSVHGSLTLDTVFMEKAHGKDGGAVFYMNDDLGEAPNQEQYFQQMFGPKGRSDLYCFSIIYP